MLKLTSYEASHGLSAIAELLVTLVITKLMEIFILRNLLLYLRICFIKVVTIYHSRRHNLHNHLLLPSAKLYH